MNKSLLLTFGAAAVATLAGCVDVAGPVTPGRATMAEVEQSCVNQLARDSYVNPNQVSVAGSTGSSEGTALSAGRFSAARSSAEQRQVWAWPRA
jgi:hypothetical protein